MLLYQSILFCVCRFFVVLLIYAVKIPRKEDAYYLRSVFLVSPVLLCRIWELLFISSLYLSSYCFGWDSDETLHLSTLFLKISLFKISFPVGFNSVKSFFKFSTQGPEPVGENKYFRTLFVRLCSVSLRIWLTNFKQLFFNLFIVI